MNNNNNSQNKGTVFKHLFKKKKKNELKRNIYCFCGGFEDRSRAERSERKKRVKNGQRAEKGKYSGY